MICRSVHGVPRPVGSRFEHRVVYAPTPRISHDVPWKVAKVRTIGGVTLEAKFHLDASAIVATDIEKHSMVDDVLRKTRAVLDDDGWTTGTVEACDVPGCDEPLPMWKCVTGRRAGDQLRECLSCEARTVRECRECGQPDPARYVGRERLLTEQICFRCDLWVRRAEQVADAPAVVITPGFEMYTIGDGRGPKSAHGFGGTQFTVSFDDSRTIDTDDLWSGGTVPAWLRHLFTPNGQVRSSASTLHVKHRDS